MIVCEKCWEEARNRCQSQGGNVLDHYGEILQEKKNKPCTPQEQGGIFWDLETNQDIRFYRKTQEETDSIIKNDERHKT